MNEKELLKCINEEIENTIERCGFKTKGYEEFWKNVAIQTKEYYWKYDFDMLVLVDNAIERVCFDMKINRNDLR